MKTYETRAQYLADCTNKTVNSHRPPAAPYFWTCATCGKVAPHSESYGIDAQHGMHCYTCCHARDVASLLDRSLPFSAYVSCDGRTVSNWPGGKLADISHYGESRTGWHGSTQAYFRARDVHGQWWHGRGAGKGMYCTLRPMKTPR